MAIETISHGVTDHLASEIKEIDEGCKKVAKGNGHQRVEEMRIIMLVIDSASRGSIKRSFPRTMDRMKKLWSEGLGVVGFERHHATGYVCLIFDCIRIDLIVLE